MHEDFLGKSTMYRYPVSAEETYTPNQKSHFESYKNIPLNISLFWVLCENQIKGILPHVVTDFLITYIKKKFLTFAKNFLS